MSSLFSPGVRTSPWVWWTMQNSRVWHNLQNSWALGNPWVLQPLLRDWLHDWWAGRKAVLSIACFAHSLSLLLLLLILIFPLLIKLSLSQPMSFPFCPSSSPSRWGEGEGRGSSCLVLSCWLQVKPQQLLCKKLRPKCFQWFDSYNDT